MTRPLRICFVGDARDIHVRQRTLCFAERGHEVTLLTEHAVGLSGVLEVVPPARWSRVPKLRVIGALLGHAAELRRAAPDIVHIHFAHRIPAWMTGWVEPHPLVVSLMGGDLLFEERGDRSARRRALTLHLLRAADLVTAKTTDMLAKVGPLTRRAVRVSWGIDRRAFRRMDASRLRKSLGLEDRDRVILSHRCLTPLYNIHMIVEALPRVLQRHPDAVLLISEASPDAEYKARLQELAERLGVSARVRFVGEIPHDQMREYLSLAELTVAVPSSDGLPQSLLEGLACGTPSILGQLDGYLEVVRHGESGWLVEIGVEPLAEGIDRLMSDAALRQRLAERGLEAVTHEHDFEDQVTRVEGLYRELAAGGRRQASASSRVALLRALLTGDAPPSGLAP